MSELAEAVAVLVARDRKKHEARLILNAVVSGTRVEEIAKVLGVPERHVENVRDALRLIGEL